MRTWRDTMHIRNTRGIIGLFATTLSLPLAGAAQAEAESPGDGWRGLFVNNVTLQQGSST